MAVEYIDRSKCNNCAICYNVCPTDVFGKAGVIIYIAYPEDCMSCHLCEDICKPEALYVSARRPTEIPSPYEVA